MLKGNFVNTDQGVFHYHALDPGQGVNGSGRSGTELVFCHGNSLSAGTYLPFLEQLAGQRFRVLAPDMRGHGFSTKEKTAQVDNWEIFIRDLAGFIRAKASGPVIGMGHSLGGYLIYAAAAQYPGLFSRIVLLDPIIMPWDIVITAALARVFRVSWSLPRQTRVKKSEFSSKQSALAHYRGKGMFRNWQEAFLSAFVETALEQDTTDTVELCCSPALEARLYETVPLDTWRHAPRIQVPALAVRGEHSLFFYPRAARTLSRRMTGLDSLELAGVGHFFPMEAPGKTVEAITRFITS